MTEEKRIWNKKQETNEEEYGLISPSTMQQIRKGSHCSEHMFFPGLCAYQMQDDIFDIFSVEISGCPDHAQFKVLQAPLDQCLNSYL